MPALRLTVILVGALAVASLSACGSDDAVESGTLSPTPSPNQLSTETPSVCAGSIPPLTTSPVTKERLEAAIQKMGEIERAAEAGEYAAARGAFAGDTHDVTHDIDQPLRAADPLLAQDLCESILYLELQFGVENDLQAVSGEAAISARLLRESGQALGLIE